MSLHSPNQEPQEPKGQMYIINPTTEQFSTSYLDDHNKEVYVTFAPLETRDYPRGVGEVILKHLCNFVLNNSGFGYKTDVNKELEAIKKKCVIYE